MSGALPLIRHATRGAVFARRGDATISCGTYLDDVAALASLFPEKAYVVNLCQDRYRFAVALGAALIRGQISLLPPNATPGMMAQLQAAYPDLYVLGDIGAADTGEIQSMPYPSLTSRNDAAPIPAFPPEQTAIVLFTSGSTGAPQPQPRSWGAMVASALAAGTRLLTPALQGATLIATVPHQHSYGIESTVMLGLQHGLVLDCGRPLLPADVADRLRVVPRPTILVTTPIHLKALVGDGSDLPQTDLILSATAPLAQDRAQAVEIRFAAPLREIYGCSEAGQLATRASAAETAWTCFEGVVLRQSEGRTYAGGPPVGREQALADIIELESSTRFALQGRLTDLVNIAGKRGSLAALNHHLMAIPGVEDGAFLMPDDATRLTAFAVAPALKPEAIVAHLRRHIDPAFLPRPLILLENLPRNPLGKLPRAALLEMAKGRR